MKKIFSLTLLSLVLVLGACSNDSKTKNDDTDVNADDKNEIVNEANEAEVTPEEYKELKTGMTYEEVTKIVGGIEDNRTENGVDANVIMYHYDGENGVDDDATVTLIFNNDKLETIMESGLLTAVEDEDEDDANEVNEAKVTPEKYKELKAGMTYEEVTKIVGGTEENRTENGVDANVIMYNYDGENGVDDDATVTLIFNKDKLETIMESGLLTAVEDEDDVDEANEAKVTPEKYKELKVGMTYEEVTKIVGGTEENRTENGVDANVIMYNYDGENGVDDDATVTLIFNNDKLETIMESGLLTAVDDEDEDDEDTE